LKVARDVLAGAGSRSIAAAAAAAAVAAAVVIQHLLQYISSDQINRLQQTVHVAHTWSQHKCMQGFVRET
jgi:hypothetical protein